ncbi:VapE domain-containing protein [Psychromonas sp. KJ10-2]|uniref:VapE domain-containing protein n=1 Tax=Psychromonas sp. KJ10-2 TaxID=3391822 RepID=UPI0039B4C411
MNTNNITHTRLNNQQFPYDFIPYGRWDEKGSRPAPYKLKQRYDESHQLWSKADNDRVGIRLNNLVLVDYDGNKENAVGEIPSVEELANVLGYVNYRAMADASLIQWNEAMTSLHFLFIAPPEFNVTDFKQHNGGTDDFFWKHIDIKTANQLVYLKSAKTVNLRDPSTYPLAPQAIMDQLKGRSAKSTSVTFNYEHKASEHQIKLATEWLNEACEEMENTEDGGRNNKLNSLGCTLAGLVAGGSLNNETAYTALFNAAIAAGCERGETVATLASAWEEGGKTPRRDAPYTAMKQSASEAFADHVVHNTNITNADCVITASFPDVKETRQGSRVLSTQENLKALLHSCNIQVATNAMNLNLDIQQNGTVHQLSYDAVRSELIGHAERAGLPKVAIEEHLTAIAEKNNYHPVEAALTNKEWDLIPRVQTLLNAIPTDNPKIRDLIMRKWLVSAMAAIYQPNFGTKLVPVLKGLQSAKKSAFLSRLSTITPDSFLPEATLNPDDVDSVIRVASHHIVELAELERTTRREAGALKAFITNTKDSFRKKYGRSDTKKQRQTVFIATVNGDDFFKDTTGNTRFAVIELSNDINMDVVNNVLGYQWNSGKLIQDKPELLEQFWLEVKHEFDNGAAWHLDDHEQKLIESVNNRFVAKGEFYEIIKDDLNSIWFGNPVGLTPTAITKRLNLQPNMCAKVGRDLKQLVKDGILCNGQGRLSREYFIYNQ